MNKTTPSSSSAPRVTGRPKLLCLCDSPTTQTGFARVAQNLLQRWNAADLFEQIWIWGIGFSGFPHELPYNICPAQSYSRPHWHDADNLRRFLLSLKGDSVGGTPGGYTHVWIMQDTFMLAPIAEGLQEICRSQNIRSLLYFPVDARLEPRWCNIVAAVDVPVAYCEYGRTEAQRGLSLLPPEPPATSPRLIKDARKRQQKSLMRRMDAAKRIQVLPHGVDRKVYRPIDGESRAQTRAQIRAKMFRDMVGPEDFLLVNVNQNQKRKGIPHSLMVLRRIQQMRPELRAKLYLHMPAESPSDFANMREVAVQLGLVPGRDVFFADKQFSNGHPLLHESELNMIYNAADVLLTTTYGEGWGLSITEAMAAGLPVAGPRHTSVAEILDQDRGILFNTLGEQVLPGDMSRLRPCPDVDDAALRLVNARMAGAGEWGSLASTAQRATEWLDTGALDWNTVAARWLDLFFPGVKE